MKVIRILNGSDDMFEAIEKWIKEMKRVIEKSNKGEHLTNEDMAIINYSDLHLVEALMTDWGSSIAVAKIILAESEKE